MSFNLPPSGRRARPMLSRFGIYATTGLLLVFGGAIARADNLDAALLKHAPDVMSYLEKHHCRNVGVLKFRVHKPGHHTDFKAGPITDNMVERLENALIAVNPSSAPVGIIRDADRVAVELKLPSYDHPPGQHALFQHKYPLAWGKDRVTPDRMLTGVITTRPDLKFATVRIEAFGPDTPKQDKVVEFEVATDRSLLTDLGESFKISSRKLKRGTRDIQLDEDAVASAATSTQTPDPSTTVSPTGPTSTNSATSADNLLYYEIRYDGQPQTVSADPANPNEFTVSEPRENQKISFAVKSLASERIGLVLMVNGKSTLYEEDSDPSHCKAWVLEPGKLYGIDGFQMDNNTRKPFRVLSDADSAAVTYGPNTGTIQFHIFREGGASVGGTGGTAGAGDNATATDDSATQSRSVSLRGLRTGSAKPRSLAELKQLVDKHAHVKVRKRRGLIMGDDNTVAGAIENDEIQNQTLVQSITVRYYRPKPQ